MARAKYSTLDITRLLQDEMDTFVQPKVRDPETATTEALIKDVHRILTGNGGLTRGVMWKLAETRVDIRRVREDVADVDEKVDAQVSYCRDVQDKVESVKQEKEFNRRAVEKKRTRRRKAVSWLLNNKAFMSVVAAIAMAVAGWARGCVVVLGGQNQTASKVSQLADGN